MKTFKIATVLGAATLGLAFAFTAVNAAEEAGKAVTPSSRVELFNGKDFTGWTFFMRTNADPMQTWSITNGVIACTGKPNGYARTEKNYQDYKLTVEWRFVRVAPRADNTGVLLHMGEPDKVWPKCVEAQGQSGKQGEFWLQSGATCKGYDTPTNRHVLCPQPPNEKPVGEWNTFQAACASNHIQIYVNGKLMNEAAECNVSSGHIGLQSEGAAIEVRKVFLEPIK